MTTAPSSDTPAPGTGTGGSIWINGDMHPADAANISVYDHGFLYGDGCFEGIRVYSGRIFKLRSHLERLYRSSSALYLEPAYDIDTLDAVVREVVESNGIDDGYVRLIITRGVGSLGLNPFKCTEPGTIVIADAISLYPDEYYQSGLQVMLSSRPRIPVICLDPAIKSLNYLNNILAKAEALHAGMQEALMLNVDGFVAECSGDNIFIIRGEKVLTPSTDAGILNGITRQFIIQEVGPDIGLEVVETSLRLEDVLGADEVFLTGTAAEVIGVTEIDGKQIGDGAVGPTTRAVETEFHNRVSVNAPED